MPFVGARKPRGVSNDDFLEVLGDDVKNMISKYLYKTTFLMSLKNEDFK